MGVANLRVLVYHSLTSCLLRMCWLITVLPIMGDPRPPLSDVGWQSSSSLVPAGTGSSSGHASGLAAIAAENAANNNDSQRTTMSNTNSSSGNSSSSAPPPSSTSLQPTISAGGKAHYVASSDHHLPMTGAELTLNAAQLRLLFPRENTLTSSSSSGSSRSTGTDSAGNTIMSVDSKTDNSRPSFASIEARMNAALSAQQQQQQQQQQQHAAATPHPSAAAGNMMTSPLTVPVTSPPLNITPPLGPRLSVPIPSATLAPPPATPHTPHTPSPHALLPLPPPPSSASRRRSANGNIAAAVAEAVAANDAANQAAIVSLNGHSTTTHATSGGGSGRRTPRTSIVGGTEHKNFAPTGSPNHHKPFVVATGDGSVQMTPVRQASSSVVGGGGANNNNLTSPNHPHPQTPNTPGGQPRRLLSRISEIAPTLTGANESGQPMDHGQLLMLRRLNANEDVSSNPTVLQQLIEEEGVDEATESVAERIGLKKPRHRWWLIDADSKYKMMWDFMMIVWLIYSIIVVPLNIAFGDIGQTWTMNIIVDCFFWVDICLAFITLPTRLEDRRNSTSNKQRHSPAAVARSYATTWFIPDLLSVFPFHAIINDGLQYLLLFRVFRILRLVKFVSAERYQRFLQHWEYQTNGYVHPGIMRIIKLFLSMFALAHFFACILLYLADPDNPESWIVRASFDLLSATEARRYLVALYWTITTLTTVGYGDISPHTNSELGLTLAVMISGTTFFGALTASVASIVTTLDHRATILRDRMQSLAHFMATLRLPKLQRIKLTSELEEAWMQELDRPILEWDTFKRKVSVDMRVKVAEKMYRHILKTPFFIIMSENYPDFIPLVLPELKPMYYSPGEPIARAGDIVEHWSIISYGLVDLMSPNIESKKYRTLEMGGTFGEVGIMNNLKYEANIFCSEDSLGGCELLQISPAVLFRIIARVDRREDAHEILSVGHSQNQVQHYHVDKRGLRFPDRIRAFFKTRADRNLHRVETMEREWIGQRDRAQAAAAARLSAAAEAAAMIEANAKAAELALATAVHEAGAPPQHQAMDSTESAASSHAMSSSYGLSSLFIPPFAGGSKTNGNGNGNGAPITEATQTGPPVDSNPSTTTAASAPALAAPITAVDDITAHPHHHQSESGTSSSSTSSGSHHPRSAQYGVTLPGRSEQIPMLIRSLTHVPERRR